MFPTGTLHVCLPAVLQSDKDWQAQHEGFLLVQMLQRLHDNDMIAGNVTLDTVVMGARQQLLLVDYGSSRQVGQGMVSSTHQRPFLTAQCLHHLSVVKLAACSSPSPSPRQGCSEWQARCMLSSMLVSGPMLLL